MTPERINQLLESGLWGIANYAEIKELCDLALKGLSSQGYVGGDEDAAKMREIRAAYLEEYRLRDAIRAEMSARAQEGTLWENGIPFDKLVDIEIEAAKQQLHEERLKRALAREYQPW